MATRILVEIEDDGTTSVRCDALDVALEAPDVKAAAFAGLALANEQIARLAPVEADLRAPSRARLAKWRVLAEIMDRLG